jgi:mono/diheme cytochrome c family protein
MSKYAFRLILMLVALMLLLAACGPAEPGATTPGTTNGAAPMETQAVPGTVPDTLAQCAGVDTQELATAGQQLYETSCASCHGAQGEGVGDFPAIAGNTAVTGDDVVQLVQNYFAVEAHPRDVTAQDLASLFTYVRGAFGNSAEVVCPEVIQLPVTQ